MIHQRGKLKGRKRSGKNPGRRLPEPEYLKLSKLVKKHEHRFATHHLERRTVLANRAVKKVESLVARAQYLEVLMMVPKERRWTNAYS